MKKYPIRRFDSLDAMKAEEYDYWRQRPAHERLDAVTRMIAETHQEPGADAPRLQRTLAHIQR